jgi:hypothetical protein
MATDQALTLPADLETGSRGPLAFFRDAGRFFKRNLTRKSGAALVVWRIETWMATPAALLFVATLGRWEGALAMGALMAAYAAIFLLLLEGERVIVDIREWAAKRSWTRWAAPRETGGHRWALLTGLVMVFGPFWRAVTFQVAAIPRIPAYALSVGGSFPHSLLWTGLVVGGLYEAAIRPTFESLV